MVVPSMVSARLSLRYRGARATGSALQVEDCQYPHLRSGYWCVLMFRIRVHCPVTGGKLEPFGPGRIVEPSACLLAMDMPHSPHAFALKGASKGPSLASAF